MQPPYNLDAERGVLGAILLYNQHLSTVVSELRLIPEDFYREQHRIIFHVMLELEGQPIDSITIADRIDGTTVADVEALAAHVPVAGHVREYAQVVKDHAVRRRVLAQAQQVAESARSTKGDVRDLIAQAEERMLSLTDVTTSQLDRLTAQQELARLADVRDGKQQDSLSSGFKDLDDLIGGFYPARLILLAARPSQGKSTLAGNMAQHVAQAQHTVALFTLEMDRQEIIRRLISAHAKLPGETLMRGPINDLHYQKAQKALEEIVSWPLFVDDTADLSLAEARSKLRRLHAQHPLSLVIIDYVQLMRTERAENRNVEMGQVSRGLKILAKDLRVPVIAVSQLSRRLETRTDRRPVLSDLRDTGQLEQDADLVMFVYRDEYYNKDAEKGIAELSVAKNRGGPTGQVTLTFLDKYPRFANYVDPDKFAETTVPTAEAEWPF